MSRTFHVIRYFKLSWNTTALSQSNSTNFSCSSINSETKFYHDGLFFFSKVCKKIQRKFWINALKNESGFANKGPLHMSPVDRGLARLPGWISLWVHMRNFSPVSEMRKGQRSWGRVLTPNLGKKANIAKHKNFNFRAYLSIGNS